MVPMESLGYVYWGQVWSFTFYTHLLFPLLGTECFHLLLLGNTRVLGKYQWYQKNPQGMFTGGRYSHFPSIPICCARCQAQNVLPHCCQVTYRSQENINSTNGIPRVCLLGVGMVKYLLYPWIAKVVTTLPAESVSPRLCWETVQNNNNNYYYYFHDDNP